MVESANTPAWVASRNDSRQAWRGSARRCGRVYLQRESGDKRWAVGVRSSRVYREQVARRAVGTRPAAIEDTRVLSGRGWGTMSAHNVLRGRKEECAALDVLLDAARRGESRTVVLRGEAGVGKTALLDYAIGSAPDFRVLRCVGVESEMELAFAFVARRLMAEPISLVFAVREPIDLRELAGLPELMVGGLREDDARVLLESTLPGRLDERVRERIIAEARGNPLALLELPRGLTPSELAGGFAL